MRNEALELPRDTGHQLSIDGMQIYQNKLSGFIDRKAVLIAQTKRTGDRKCNHLCFHNQWAEAVDEKGVWCTCTVEEVSNDRLRDRFV